MRATSGVWMWPKRLDNFEEVWDTTVSQRTTTPTTSVTSPRPTKSSRLRRRWNMAFTSPLVPSTACGGTSDADHNHLYAPRAYSNWNWGAEWAAVTKTFWFNKLTAEAAWKWPGLVCLPLDALPFETPRWSSMDYYTSTDYRRQVALDAFIKRRWRPDVPDWDEFFCVSRRASASATD